MKKFLTVLVSLAMVFGLVACGGGTPASSAPAASGSASTASESEALSAAVEGTIGFSVSTLNNPFFVTLTEGAQSKAGEMGVELILLDAGDDAAKQTSDIEDLISRNIDVLLVNPVDSDAVAPVVQDAVDAGIKVIAVDRVVNGVEVDSQIASDNVAGAEMAAEYLVELVGEGAKVAELEGVPGASATVDRGTGFHNIADEQLDVVTSQTANFNRAEGLSVTENILQGNPDLAGIFAHNDEMALGAIEAAGNREIVIIGFDATDDAQAAVADGRMAATVAQQPALMGETAVEAAIKLIQGESVEKDIPVEVTLIKQ